MWVFRRVILMIRWCWSFLQLKTSRWFGLGSWLSERFKGTDDGPQRFEDLESLSCLIIAGRAFMKFFVHRVIWEFTCKNAVAIMWFKRLVSRMNLPFLMCDWCWVCSKLFLIQETILINPWYKRRAWTIIVFLSLHQRVLICQYCWSDL